MVIPFSSRGRDVSGLTKTKLYKSSMDRLRLGWEKQAVDTKVGRIKTVEIPSIKK